MENRIRVIRAAEKLTQEALAKKAGISRTALVAIERGNSTPDGNTIAKLVKALNMPAGEIFLDLNVMQTYQMDIIHK